MMAHHTPSADEVKGQARRAAREAGPWVERLGRFGYAANGVVYAIVGGLAAQAASGGGGATTDSRGALQWIVQAPFGRALLGVIAIGLLGYAAWRCVQATWDTENKGSDPKGVATRAMYVAIGGVYAGLALSAAQLAVGSGGGGNGDGPAQDWTARLLAQPFGQWLVGIVGATVVGVACFQFYSAYSAKFREKLRLTEMTAAQETWATQIGRLGYAARGVALSVIGGFLALAAIQAEPRQARGLGGALATVAEQPFGPWLLGAVALGFIAYGVFMLVEARYGRMVIG